MGGPPNRRPNGRSARAIGGGRWRPIGLSRSTVRSRGVDCGLSVKNLFQSACWPGRGCPRGSLILGRHATSKEVGEEEWVGARYADRDHATFGKWERRSIPRRVIRGSDDHCFPVRFFEASGEIIRDATARTIHEMLSIGLAGATASEGGAEFANRTDRVAADGGAVQRGPSPAWFHSSVESSVPSEHRSSILAVSAVRRLFRRRRHPLSCRTCDDAES